MRCGRRGVGVVWVGAVGSVERDERAEVVEVGGEDIVVVFVWLGCWWVGVWGWLSVLLMRGCEWGGCGGVRCPGVLLYAFLFLLFCCCSDMDRGFEVEGILGLGVYV